MMRHHAQPGKLFSIGYGDKPWEDFLARLRQHRVSYLVDVRSQPGSRQQEFQRDALRILLSQSGIRYVFMGDLLGGKPNDPRCYVAGKVDYSRCEQREQFAQGLKRLRTAAEGGHRVALMCSELDPERCHRSKLIGEAMKRQGLPVEHIDRDGSLASQEAVIARLTGGQGALFGSEFTSRERYSPAAGEGSRP